MKISQFTVLLLFIVITFVLTTMYINNIESNIKKYITKELQLEGEEFSDRQDNNYYTCPECGSDSVYEEIWLNPNTDDLITMYDDTCYCMHCKKHISELKLIKNGE